MIQHQRDAVRLPLIADFIVVRQHTAPSEKNPSAASLLGFIVAHQHTVPSGKSLLLHHCRILGVSHTRGMPPSIHFYYMSFPICCQLEISSSILGAGVV